jgi:broad specificity phosphatase PhoE
MTVIYLLRHGEADYRQARKRQWAGSIADLAPLSARGIEQAAAAAGALSKVGATALVSSPFTRAMQTASAVACRLGVPLQVEFDLYEWQPDGAFSGQSYAEFMAVREEFEDCGGEWPDGQCRAWEPLSAVRQRTSTPLRKAVARMNDGGALIAVCHGMVIRALTGEHPTGTGEFRRIDSDLLPDLTS